ncbi:MAG: hypothetical protein ACPIOQ_61170, partial [Promethearchaeia archaeon]
EGLQQLKIHANERAENDRDARVVKCVFGKTLTRVSKSMSARVCDLRGDGDRLAACRRQPSAS